MVTTKSYRERQAAEHKAAHGAAAKSKPAIDVETIASSLKDMIGKLDQLMAGDEQLPAHALKPIRDQAAGALEACEPKV